MDNSFQTFLDHYLAVWKSSSLTELKDLISQDYKAREITGGKIVDFGYEESIQGWEQGFNFVKENKGQWDINQLSILPLREDEMMVIVSATIIIQGKSIETSNLFFETFQKGGASEWKLVRSYIEAGVPNEIFNGTQFN